MTYARSLTALSFFLVPLPLAAQVVVTEIMYDLAEGSDSGREWVEVYAAGAVDLTKFKLVENGSNHSIKATNGASVPAGAYAVIADNPVKFAADHPGYAGFLFDSAFSLNNEGESIAIADVAGNALDAVAYTNASANGTGDSLQRNPGGNQFEAGVPTPGLGIPAKGLTKSVPPQKVSKKAAKAAPVSAPEIQGTVTGKSDFPSSSPVALAAAASSGMSFAWWLGPLLLAGSAGAGISLSRHFRKSEWQIVEEAVEETDETG
jgi:hypothetical protein